jgi:hypothetical protein
LSTVSKSNHLKLTINPVEFDTIIQKIKQLEKTKIRLIKLNTILND